MQFYSLAPCRLVDTRNANGNLGGPRLEGGQARNFPLLEATNCIPQGTQVKAYSLNFTAIPNPAGQDLGYLTAWPQGLSQPTVSTLNNPTATYVANAAIIPAGAGGGVSVYVDQSTDLAIDINGYFALAGNGGAVVLSECALPGIGYPHSGKRPAVQRPDRGKCLRQRMRSASHK